MVIKVTLPPALYTELRRAAATYGDPNYTTAAYATDLLVSELASRRLSKIAGPRAGVTERNNPPSA